MNYSISNTFSVRQLPLTGPGTQTRVDFFEITEKEAHAWVAKHRPTSLYETQRNANIWSKFFDVTFELPEKRRQPYPPGIMLMTVLPPGYGYGSLHFYLIEISATSITGAIK